MRNAIYPCYLSQLCDSKLCDPGIRSASFINEPDSVVVERNQKVSVDFVSYETTNRT